MVSVVNGVVKFVVPPEKCCKCRKVSCRKVCRKVPPLLPLGVPWFRQLVVIISLFFFFYSYFVLLKTFFLYFSIVSL